MKNILDIEQQMYALELQKQKLEQEEKYNQLLKEQDSIISSKCKQQLRRNNLIIEKFNELVSLGCGEYIELKRKMVSIWWYENKNGYGEKLKKEDYKSIDFQQTYIKFKKSSSTININSDGKLELPGIIYSRFQSISVKTAANKIKEYFINIEREIKEKDQLKFHLKKLSKDFHNKYPNSLISSETKYISNNFGRGYNNGYNIHILKILFENGNWIKLRVYGDGSWSIKEKYEAVLKELTKEEIIDRLAP